MTINLGLLTYILNLGGETPDFIIKAPIEFYIEVVVANIKNIGRKEDERIFEDQSSMLIPPPPKYDNQK